jgi:hypothetical protein
MAAFALEHQIKVYIKPSPRFITDRLWRRLAEIFVYLEKSKP